MTMEFISGILDELKDRSLLRDYITIESAQEPTVQINEKPYLSFCSNNYLGLANHPIVAAWPQVNLPTQGFLIKLRQLLRILCADFEMDNSIFTH